MLQRSKDEYIQSVLKEVKFSFDHQKIAEELQDHLDEHIDCLISEGFDEEQALIQAIAAMGDGSEMGKELNEVHKPLWGRLLLFGRVALIITLICIGVQIVYPYAINIYESKSKNQSITEYLEWSLPETKVLKSTHHDIRFNVGNYRYSIEEIAIDSKGDILIKLNMKYRNILKKGEKLSFGSGVVMYDNDDLQNELTSYLYGYQFYKYEKNEYLLIESNQDIEYLRIEVDGHVEVVKLEVNDAKE